jgi:DNA-binding transcriptional LysR family regulator
MESIYLKTLIEVVRTGSLTKAAETLHVTQSAVSRRIKFLEESYDRSLLDRSGPLLIPTPEGQLVLKKAGEILDLEKELLSELSSLERKQELAFICTPTFGIVHLPDILREFMLKSSEAGNLKFLFEMPEKIVRGLKKGLFEMAVIEHCQCFDLSDFETVALPGDEMVFAVNPALGITDELTDIESLFAQTLYARDEGCCSRTLLENNLQAMGRTTSEFRQIVTYDDLHIIVQALLNGEGVAFISSEIIAPYVRSGRLTTFKIAGFTHQRCRTFLFNNILTAGSPAAQFVETLLERFPQVGKGELPSCCDR